MPLFPILMLLALAVAGWLVRSRPERVVWGVSVVGQFAVWLSLLFMKGLIPIQVQLSVWQPVSLFATPVNLELDRIGWTVSFVISTLLLAISLTSVARAGSATPATRTFMCVFGALGMAAAMAGNLLTAAVLWALIDGVAFASHLVLVRRAEMVPVETTRLGVGGISIGCLLASASLASSGPRAGNALVVAGILALVGGALRMGFYPAHYQLPALPGVRRGLGTLLRLVPAAVGLALMARQLDSQLVKVLAPWMMWAGMLTGLTAAFLWALHRDPVERRPMLVLGLAGITLGAAGLQPDQAQDVLLAGATTVVLVGGLVSLAVLHESWHRGWVVLAGFMILGGPGTASQLIAASLLRGALGLSHMAVAVAGCIGLIGLAVGVLRLAFETPQAWVSGEDLVRFAYAAGLGLPFLAALTLGVWSFPVKDWVFLILFVLLGVVSSLVFVMIRRRNLLRNRDLLDAVGRLSLPALPNWVAKASNSPLRALTWVSRLIEGEAAMLWVLFLLLALAAVAGAAR